MRVVQAIGRMVSFPPELKFSMHAPGESAQQLHRGHLPLASR